MKNNRLITIQDLSCLGQCSITVALPIISALGVETCPIPSAILSNHTSGFDSYSCLDLTAQIPTIINQCQNMNFDFDLIYTVYIASEQQIEYLSKVFLGFASNFY